MKNSQFRRISINEPGRNSLVHEKASKSQLNPLISGTPWERINLLIEESLQLTEYYRARFENSRVIYENFQALNPSQSIEFPSRPIRPIEFIGKSLENSSTDILINSDLNKSDGWYVIIFLDCLAHFSPSDRTTLIGQYDISHRFIPRSKSMSPTSFESLMKFHEKFFFQSFVIYSKYLHQLFELSFSSIDYYDHQPMQRLLLSFTEQIKDMFKRIFSRYRIVIQTFLYEHIDQSMIIASKCLINRKADYLFEEHLVKRNLHLIITSYFLSQD